MSQNYPFIPLNIVTDRTYGYQSTIVCEKLADTLKNLGFTTAGVADWYSLSYLPSFIKKSKSKGIFPLTGCRFKTHYHGIEFEFVLIAKTELGFIEINRLVRNYSGLKDQKIISTTDFSNILNNVNISKIILGNANTLTKLNEKISIGSDIYIGLEYLPKTSEFIMINKIEFRFPLIAFPMITKFVNEKTEYKVLRAIKLNEKFANISEDTTVSLEKLEVFNELYKNENFLLKNTFLFTQKHLFIPKEKAESVPIQNKNYRDDVSQLISLCIQNLIIKKHLFPSLKFYFDRLRYELSVILSKKFASYFILVWKILKFCHQNGIIVLARGSAAGSLVTRLLDISYVDPIKTELFFERFLNPERLDFPDYDLDVSADKRSKVIEFMKNNWTKDDVCYIMTYEKIHARWAIRNTGKAMGFSSFQIGNISNLIRKSTIVKVSLKTELEENNDIKSIIEKDTRLKDMCYIASHLEGINFAFGSHAAGLTIVPNDQKWMVPILIEDDIKTLSCSMNEMGFFGLLKIDVLGVTSLDIINDVISDLRVKLSEIPQDNPLVFKHLVKGSTVGLFQVSVETSHIIKRSKPQKITDISDIIALNRPGSIQYVDEYIKRKVSDEWKENKIGVLMNKNILKILEKTNGIIIYQEQVMHIAIHIAGYTVVEADQLRKIIAKKQLEQMSVEKERFLLRCKDKGLISEEESIELFSIIENWKGYGFNKAHGMAYATNTYYMAYLKYFYPLEFYSYSIKYENDEFKRAILYYDAIYNKIQVKIANYNKSELRTTYKNNCIFIGLEEIKGVSTLLANKIISERNQKAFQSKEDFVRRCVRTAREEKILKESGIIGDISFTDSSKLMKYYGFDPLLTLYKNNNSLSLHDFVFNYNTGINYENFKVKVLNITNKRGTSFFDNTWYRKGNTIIHISDGSYALRLLVDESTVPITFAADNIILVDLIYKHGHVRTMEVQSAKEFFD